MTIGPEHEAPVDATGAGPGFSDAVTFAFGDARAEVYGIARVGLAGGQASGLAMVFAGTEPVAVNAEGAIGAPGADAWEDVIAAGIACTIERPLEAWTVSFEDPRAHFALRFEARSAPAVLDPGDPAAKLGGMQGYDQVCAVTGTVHIGDRLVAIDCLGQRGHTWGEPDWDRISVARTVTAWMEDERAVALTAVRPIDATNHMAEEMAAFYVEGGEPQAVDDPRLSTGYDGDGHQRRAGLELWVTEDGEYARRLGGEVLAGTTLDLGRLRLDCAFFLWRMEGQLGVGRYDVLRRVES